MRHVWPNLRIVGIFYQRISNFKGEEEEDYQKELGIDYKNFKRDLVNKNIFPTTVNREIDLERCIVWVDPIDGTRDFVSGIDIKAFLSI